MVAADRIAKAARGTGPTSSASRPHHSLAGRDGPHARELSREGIAVPILIGGATTSPAHTAVKIAPAVPQPVVHVVDASRAVGVAGSSFPRSCAGVPGAEREAPGGASARPRGAAEQAPPSARRSARRRRSLDWAAADIPVPSSTGVRVEEDVPLAELIPFVDWSPFFHAWSCGAATADPG